MSLERLLRWWRGRLFASCVSVDGLLKERQHHMKVVGLGDEALEYATLYGRCALDADSIRVTRRTRFLPWVFLCLFALRRAPNEVWMMALPGPWKQFLKFRSDARSPLFVWHRIDMSGEWEEMTARMTSMRRSQIRQYVKQPPCECSFSSDEEDFTRFYEDLYTPFVATRHGDLARPLDRTIALEHFRTGGMLKMQHQGRWAAAALLREDESSLEISLVAVARNADGTDAVKHGQLGLYVESIRRARALGKRWVDLSGTKPFPMDGLFLYKSSYGSTVSSMGAHIGLVHLLLPAEPAMRSGLLAAAPILGITRDGDLRLVQ